MRRGTALTPLPCDGRGNGTQGMGPRVPAILIGRAIGPGLILSARGSDGMPNPGHA